MPRQVGPGMPEAGGGRELKRTAGAVYLFFNRFLKFLVVCGSAGSALLLRLFSGWGCPLGAVCGCGRFCCRHGL